MKLVPYPKYKPSGIKWLGDVPTHWDVKAIKWESPVLRGASPRPIDNDIYFDEAGEYAWVRITDVSAAGMYLHETTQRLSNLGQSLSVSLQPGTLFLSIAGTVGKPCITAIKCCIHDGFVYFPFWRGESRFLYYLFSSDECYGGLGKLGTQLNLNTDTVGSIVAGFPKPNEQRTIADFLDLQTAKIDTLMAKKRTLIERLNEKRVALISRTVTRSLPPDAATAYGLDPHPKLKPSKIEWLGEVPEHWDVDRIKWSTKGTINGIWGDEPNGANDLICIRVTDFDRERFLVVDEPPTLRAVEIAQRKKRLLHKGDLLIEKSGGGEKQLVGCVVYFDHEFEAVCSNFVARMPTSRGHVPRYWSYVHAALYAGRLNYPAVKQTTGIQNLDSAAYLETKVTYPPSEEQRAIADFLDRETEKIYTSVAKIKTAIERLQEYRTALITAAVTGKIDVRETII